MEIRLPETVNKRKKQRAGTSADLLSDFDPKRLPILAAHWFGWRSLDDAVSQRVQDLAFHRSRALVGERPIGAP